MNPPPASEKSTKKVSRACNTCRLKRKKCDGLDPCLFCTETKVECSYSREPRRRGPPSGYLRYTETRVTLLETLLGLFILRAAVPIETSVADILLENIRVLQTESKSCTQDVWDAYKASWTASQAAKVLDELANTFAPFTPRPDQEGFSKPLLPTNGAQPPNSQTKQHPAESPPTMQRSPSPPVKTQENSTWVEPQVQGPSHGPPPSHASQSISFLLPSDSAFAMSRESFERTQSPPPPHTHPPQNSQSFPVHPSQGAPQEDLSALDFAFPGGAGQDTLQYPAPPPASPHHSHRHYHQEAMMDTSGDVSMIDADMSGNLVIPDGFHDHDPDSYTGSYWRTADLALSEVSVSPSSFKNNVHFLPLEDEMDLPPIHIVSNLLDVYFQHVHRSFPFLPPRETIDALLSSSSSLSEGSTCLMLALCAYAGRLSPSPESANNAMSAFADDTGKIAADLWYEQARTGMNSMIRKGSKLENVQTMLLLALRDHGKGNESQAWLLVGMAVRMGQELELNVDNTHTAASKLRYPPEEMHTRRNVWGVAVVLDLFLSLQLGRPPAIVDSLRTSPPHILHPPQPHDLGSLSFLPGLTLAPPDSLFACTYSLCQIISRINLQLYLGFNPHEKSLNGTAMAAVPPSLQQQQGRDDAKLMSLHLLRNELDLWHQGLPHQFRISIGHPPEREVLEVNMFYHVAIILLYRPFFKDSTVQHAADVFLDAASTFNVLLEKYRNSYIPATTASSHPVSSLPLSNPNMIYLIFTVAIAHLSGYKLKQQQTQKMQQSSQQRLGLMDSNDHSRATTVALQTQLHLLNCLDALKSIAGTWDLARRCWKTLDRLIEVEGMKPQSAQRSASNSISVSSPPMDGMSGKRKREEDDLSLSALGLVGQRQFARVDALSVPHPQRRRENENAVASSSSTVATTVNPIYAGRPSASPQGTDASSISTALVSTPTPADGDPFTSAEDRLNSALMDWHKTSMATGPPAGATGGLNLSPLPISTDFFDPALFSSGAGWFSSGNGLGGEADSMGLGMVWDGEWDESLWGRTLNLGYDGTG